MAPRTRTPLRIASPAPRADDHARAQSALYEVPEAMFALPAVVAFSAPAAVAVDSLATALAAALRVPYYDEPLTERLAADPSLRQQMTASLDPRALACIDGFLAGRFEAAGRRPGAAESAYLDTVASLWAHGPAVLASRGAAHVLPRTHTLTVRFTAPFDVRVAAVRLREHVSESEAAARLRMRDLHEQRLVARMTGADVDSAEAYDVVIATAGDAPTSALGQLEHAYRMKFGRAARARDADASGVQPKRPWFLDGDR